MGESRSRAGGTLALAMLLAACGSGSAPPAGGVAKRECADRNLERNAYFGDLHVHTKYSLDASTQGTNVGPHDAYRFARGERIPVQPYDQDGNGLRSTQIARPLDFAAVTDHSEFFGETEICTHPSTRVTTRRSASSTAPSRARPSSCSTPSSPSAAARMPTAARACPA